MVMIASGFLTSCATPAASLPMLFIFSASINCKLDGPKFVRSPAQIRQRNGELGVCRLQFFLGLLGLGDVAADADEALHFAGLGIEDRRLGRKEPGVCAPSASGTHSSWFSIGSPRGDDAFVIGLEGGRLARAGRNRTTSCR